MRAVPACARSSCVCARTRLIPICEVFVGALAGEYERDLLLTQR